MRVQWNHSNDPLRRSERTSRVSVWTWDVLRQPADMDDRTAYWVCPDSDGCDVLAPTMSGGTSGRA